MRHDDNDKPLLRQATSDEMTHGIELAVTPVLFGGFGWLLDSWLGTGPFLMFGLAAFAIVGTIAKMWFGYDDAMRSLESTSRWARRDGAAPAAADEPATTDLWSTRKVSDA